MRAAAMGQHLHVDLESGCMPLYRQWLLALQVPALGHEPLSMDDLLAEALGTLCSLFPPFPPLFWNVAV